MKTKTKNLGSIRCKATSVGASERGRARSRRVRICRCSRWRRSPGAVNKEAGVEGVGVGVGPAPTRSDSLPAISRVAEVAAHARVSADGPPRPSGFVPIWLSPARRNRTVVTQCVSANRRPPAPPWWTKSDRLIDESIADPRPTPETQSEYERCYCDSNAASVSGRARAIANLPSLSRNVRSRPWAVRRLWPPVCSAMCTSSNLKKGARPAGADGRLFRSPAAAAAAATAVSMATGRVHFTVPPTFVYFASPIFMTGNS